MIFTVKHLKIKYQASNIGNVFDISCNTDNQTLINRFIENCVNLIRHTINVVYSYCIIRFLTMTTTVETSRSTCQR